MSKQHNNDGDGGDEYETLESLREEIKHKSREDKKYKVKESFNAVAFDYTLENELATSRVNNKINFVKQDNKKNQTPQQAKLNELRNKLNQSKKEIYKQVVEEHDRKHNNSKESELEEKKRMYQEKKKQMEESIQSEGGDPEREKMKHVLASDINIDRIEKSEKKKKEKKNAKENRDYDSHVHNSYKKRVKNMEAFKESNHFVHEKQDDKVLDDLEYGTDSYISKANINAMTQELATNIQDRASNFKKRGVNPDEDVNYVNEQNRQYNKKLSTAYDKYTLEIRQNLERGTAL